jgi:hypothetical protein
MLLQGFTNHFKIINSEKKIALLNTMIVDLAIVETTH